MKPRREPRQVHLEVEGLTTSYRIESDRYCFCVTSRQVVASGKNVGEERWTVLPASFLSTFEAACRRLMREGLREGKKEGIEALIEHMGWWMGEIVKEVRKLDKIPKTGEKMVG